jgi:diguanylate cyclase (GGDEF)-like protein
LEADHVLSGLDSSDTGYMSDAVELRKQVARSLGARARTVVKDSIAVYAFAGLEGVAAPDRVRLAENVFQLLTTAIRDGALESRSTAVVELRSFAVDRGVTVRALFELVHLMERSALDELAIDDSFGANSEPWPAIAQLVRRASFDVLGSYSELATSHAEEDAHDPLTTLYTRGVLTAALEKEIQRSERFGHPFAVLLLDVDHLADINAKHGYGAGDRVLERIGIQVRSYFREQDWVARSAGDSFAVILPETQPADAEALADRVRKMIEERLELRDHRSDAQVPVTVSVGVLVVDSADKTFKAEQLLARVKEAVDRAKQAGRNRVERVDVAADRSAAPQRERLSMD